MTLLVFTAKVRQFQVPSLPYLLRTPFPPPISQPKVPTRGKKGLNSRKNDSVSGQSFAEAESSLSCVRISHTPCFIYGTGGEEGDKGGARGGARGEQGLDYSFSLLLSFSTPSSLSITLVLPLSSSVYQIFLSFINFLPFFLLLQS